MPNTAHTTSDKPIRDYSRLSRTDEALIVRAAADGRTQVEIAQLIGCSQPTVSAVLSAFEDTRSLAKVKLNNSAYALAERVIKRASVDESLEVLDRLEVLPKRERSGGSGTGISIVIGMPGQPVGPGPVLDLSPVPRLEITEKSTG